MKKIYANSFKEGFRQFRGGSYAQIITPDNGGTCYPVRGDGSLCEPRKATAKELIGLTERYLVGIAIVAQSAKP